MAVKEKIRIRIKSYDHSLADQAALGINTDFCRMHPGPDLGNPLSEQLPAKALAMAQRQHPAHLDSIFVFIERPEIRRDLTALFGENMQALIVNSVQILIHTVLLDNEDFRPSPQDLIQFVRR